MRLDATKNPGSRPRISIRGSNYVVYGVAKGAPAPADLIRLSS